ncbi:AAA family ATPase [Streptococcus hillyeri]|uniref:AAA family ATPase n=1 Tax=Streptococcus hillyeri TaxID=2282420 RepID=UPI0034E195AF
MKQLILIRGNSGSGKSTLALQLQQKLGQKTVLLPQDTLRRLILNAKDEMVTKHRPSLSTSHSSNMPTSIMTSSLLKVFSIETGMPLFGIK